jgi:primosomal protein N' (replication factor Y)
VWHARRELADRGELHYPPLARVAELTGTPAAVAEELRLLRLPEAAEVLGPVTVDVPRADDRAVQKAAEARAAARRPDRLGRGERPDKPREPEAGSHPPQQLHRALVRVPRRLGGELAAAVREAQGVRSANKAEDWVRVRIDPVHLG